MSRQSTSWFFALAIVLTTIAPVGAQAETIGSSNYAAAVADLSAPIYLRLNEPAGMAVGAAVVNDGTMGTTSLGMTWGISPGSYPNSQATSHVASLGPSVTINGSPCVGLEDDNTGASFKNFKDVNPDAANSLCLNRIDATGSDPVVELNVADVTYSFFFKTTQTATDLDGTAYASANYPPRVITSHPDNNAVGRFDLIMKNGMWILVTGATGNNVAENKTGTTPVVYNDGNWHHLVAIRQGSDATDATLYIDGVQQTLAVSSDAAGLGAQPGYGLRVGTRGNKNAGWTGTLDEIAMWGEALTPAEVGGLYQAAISVPEPSSVALLAAILLGGVVRLRRKSR